MKSNQGEKPRHLQSNCKTCVFATYEGDTQTDCKAGRVEEYKKKGLLIEAYDDDKEFYVIDGLCNFLRPPYWNNGEPDTDLAYSEVSPTHTVIIFLDNINHDNKQNIIDNICNINYDKSKIRVLLSQDGSVSKEEKEIAMELFTEFKYKKGFAGVAIKINLDNSFKDYDLFRSSQTSYCTRIGVETAIPKDFFLEIHEALNKKLLKAVIFEKSNISSISHPLVLANFMDYKDYGEFELSVEEQAKKQGLFIYL